MFGVNAKPKDKLLPTDQRRVHKFTVSVYVQGLSTPTLATGLLAQVKGFDWGTPVGKFFAFILAVIKFLWNILKWVIPVILILLLIIFVADVGIATLFYIVQHDPQLGPIITGLIPGNILTGLHNTLLFKWISDINRLRGGEDHGSHARSFEPASDTCPSAYQGALDCSGRSGHDETN